MAAAATRRVKGISGRVCVCGCAAQTLCQQSLLQTCRRRRFRARLHAAMSTQMAFFPGTRLSAATFIPSSPTHTLSCTGFPVAPPDGVHTMVFRHHFLLINPPICLQDVLGSCKDGGNPTHRSLSRSLFRIHAGARSPARCSFLTFLLPRFSLQQKTLSHLKERRWKVQPRADGFPVATWCVCCCCCHSCT